MVQYHNFSPSYRDHARSVHHGGLLRLKANQLSRSRKLHTVQFLRSEHKLPIVDQVRIDVPLRVRRVHGRLLGRGLDQTRPAVDELHVVGVDARADPEHHVGVELRLERRQPRVVGAPEVAAPAGLVGAGLSFFAVSG